MAKLVQSCSFLLLCKLVVINKILWLIKCLSLTRKSTFFISLDYNSIIQFVGELKNEKWKVKTSLWGGNYSIPPLFTLCVSFSNLTQRWVLWWGRESGRGGRGRQRVRWINANRALILQAHQGRRQGQINAEQRRPAHAGSRSHAKTPIAASVPNIPSLSPPPIHQTLHSIHQRQLSARRSHSGRFICELKQCSEMIESWAAVLSLFSDPSSHASHVI